MTLLSILVAKYQLRFFVAKKKNIYSNDTYVIPLLLIYLYTFLLHYV